MRLLALFFLTAALAGCNCGGNKLVSSIGGAVLVTLTGAEPQAATLLIAGVDRVLALANDDTRLIAGHGPVGTRAELVEYRAMLATAQERLGRLKARGLTAPQAVAAQPRKDLEARWGDGLFTGDRWIEIIYSGG